MPVAANDWVPVPQILRITTPLATRPQPASGYSTGLGDINLFDIFLLKQEGVKIGVGPLITAPSALEDELGSGKWQAGLSAVAIKSSPRWMAGTLVHGKKGFAGDGERDDVETGTLQPIVVYKLPKGLVFTHLRHLDLEYEKVTIIICHSVLAADAPGRWEIK